MKTVRLFGYGTLRRAEQPPKTARDFTVDAVAGDELQTEEPGRKAEATNLGGKPTKGGDKSWINGETMVVDASELPELDKREAPEYRRVLVTTKNGHKAFAYEYQPSKDKHLK